MRTKEGLLVDQETNIIRPQPRRQGTKSVGPTDLTDARRRTRVLIRLPAVRVGETPTAQRLSDTTKNLVSGSTALEVRTDALRIDSSHAALPAPHIEAPDWLKQPNGTLSRILERRSLLAMTLIAAGAVILAVISLKPHSEANVDPALPTEKAAKLLPDSQSSPRKSVDGSMRTADASTGAGKFKDNDFPAQHLFL